jgi:flagellar biosynthesis/type III secretory pathway protein FliH
MEETLSAAEKEVLRLEQSLAKLDEAVKNNSAEITSSQADYKVLYEYAKKLGVSLEGVTEDVNSTNVKTLTERMNALVYEGVKPVETALGQMEPELKNLGNVAQ